MLTRQSLVLCSVILASVANAFVIPSGRQHSAVAMELAATRRELFAGAFSLAGVAIVTSANADPALATRLADPFLLTPVQKKRRMRTAKVLG